MQIETELPDEQIVAAITAKYSYHIQHANNHLEHANKYKLILDAYGAIIPNTANATFASNSQNLQVVGSPPVNGSTSKATFESIILDILSDRRPRGVHELMKEHYARTGRAVKRKDFSSKLSMRAKSGNIANVEYPGLPTESRFWWGKSEWIDGEDFKEEYKARINMKNTLVRQTSLIE